MENTAFFQFVDVDKYLEMVGEFGKMQIILQLMYCLMIFPTTHQVLLLVFIGRNSPWKCTGLNAECNATSEVFDVAHAGYAKRCQLKNRSSWEFTQPKSFSVVTEWDLVCKREELLHLANSGIFIGWIFSALIVGFLSDRFGRKRILFPSLFMTILCAFAAAFTQNIGQFLVLRCLMGFFQLGTVTVISTSVVEMAGPKYRALSGTLIWISYTVVLCVTDLEAWLVSEWRLLTIIVSAPYIIFMLFCLFIPESIRWLRVNDRREEAEKILRKIAKVNGKPTPNAKLSKEEKITSHSTMIDLFRPWSRCKSTLILCFTWFTAAMAYFGVSMASGDLGGNLYRDFVLTSLVEFPANTCAILLTNKFGRKRSEILVLFIAGAACIAVAIVPSHTSNQGYIWSRVSFGMIGKMCFTFSFTVVFIWSSETFPTVVRAQGLGLANFSMAVGASTSSWVAKWLGNFHSALPFAVMGGCAVVAGLLCSMVEETKGKPTVEVLLDAHRIKEFGENGNEKNEDTDTFF